MSGSSPFSRAAFSLLTFVAGNAGCALLTDLSDFAGTASGPSANDAGKDASPDGTQTGMGEGGAGDAGALDAAPVTDGDADGGSPKALCEGTAFCSRFDTLSFVDWDSCGGYGGGDTCKALAPNALSAPYSFFVQKPALPTGGGVTAIKAVAASGVANGFELAFAYRPGVAPNSVVTIAKISVSGGGAPATAFTVAIAPAWIHVEGFYPTDSESSPNAPPLVVGAWSRIVLHVTGGTPNRATLTINGNAAFTNLTLKRQGQIGTASSLEMGLVYVPANDPTFNAMMDDVALRYE